MTKILVIEDHPTSRELMTYILRCTGYEVIETGDGRTGLELARTQRPDLVISDVQLPGMNGFEIVAAIKRDPALSAIPVVAVTASAMSGDRENIIAAGFDDYLSKPIDPEIFAHQIARHLAPPRSGP
ncbi:MAG: two-component system response regulator [Rhizobiales bacterium 32-66-11]|nr:MAG: two-component system response regulator [Rhizobiales bacterium 32-66-11]